MARVKKAKLSPRPIYPTSGRIHMMIYTCAMRLAYLKVVAEG
jgi:hypothetical protein